MTYQEARAIFDAKHTSGIATRWSFTRREVEPIIEELDRLRDELDYLKSEMEKDFIQQIERAKKSVQR